MESTVYLTPAPPSQSLEHLAGHVRTRQKAFLAALEQCGTYGKAAIMTGIEYHTVSRWIKKSPAFKALATAAKEHAEQYVVLDAIEQNFHQRAVAGKEDGQSAIIGMFLSKKINNAYRDNAVVNVQANGPLAMQFNLQATPQPVVDESVSHEK